MAPTPKKSELIALGTVKLGLPDYGYSSEPRAADFDPFLFLAASQALGVNRFDTSPRYGNAEEILGRHIAVASPHPFVSTKIDDLTPGEPRVADRMFDSVRRSLARLGLPRLDIVYLHQDDLAVISDPAIQEGLIRLKEEGLASRVGASLYSFAQCDYAMEAGVFDVLQIPVNAFDLTIYNRYVRGYGGPIRFAARSLLLQGILSNHAAAHGLHPEAEDILTCHDRLIGLAEPLCLSVVELGLAFVFALPGLDHCILGTTSIDHLRQNFDCLKIELPREVHDAIGEMAGRPKSWTNPRHWSG